MANEARAVGPSAELKLIYLGCAAPVADDFVPADRVYPGNKAGLVSFLDRVIRAKASPVATFLDLFAGTGTVALHFAAAGVRVTANDLRRASYLTNSAFLLSNGANCDRDKLRQFVAYLAALPSRPGPLARKAAGRLGPVASGKLQGCRAAIAELKAGGKVTEQEERVLLAALVQAVDRLYDAREPAVRLPLRLPRLGDLDGHTVFNQDARQLVREVEAEVVYLDPPAGPEPEPERLTLLEDVVRETLAGLPSRIPKPGGPPPAAAPSLAPLADWADPDRAIRALTDLVTRVRGRHLFLSYSSEGVIPTRTIWELLKLRGRPECFELEHGALSAHGGRVTERLFYCPLEVPTP